MSLQSSNDLLAGDAYSLIRANAASYKAQAQNALLSLQAGSVNTDFIFKMLDQVSGAINALTTWKAVASLDAYATAQGYPTLQTLSVDCNTAITAAQAVLSWVATNFPADAGGFLQGYTLNADGSRTPRTFTTVQTAGLQTALTNFIATIG
jgi:hypothetical protein